MTSPYYSSAASAAVAAGGTDRSNEFHYEPIIQGMSTLESVNGDRSIDRKLVAAGAVKLMLPSKFNGYRGPDTSGTIFDALPGSKAGVGSIELPAADASSSGGKLRPLPKALMPKDARRASQQMQPPTPGRAPGLPAALQPRRSSLAAYPSNSRMTSQSSVAHVPPPTIQSPELKVENVSTTESSNSYRTDLFNEVVVPSSSPSLSMSRPDLDVTRRRNSSSVDPTVRRSVVYEPNAGMLMLRQMQADRESVSVRKVDDEIDLTAKHDDNDDAFAPQILSPAPSDAILRHTSDMKVTMRNGGTRSGRRSSFADSLSFFASSDEEGQRHKVLPPRPSFMPKPSKYLQFNFLNDVNKNGVEGNLPSRHVGQPEIVRSTTIASSKPDDAALMMNPSLRKNDSDIRIARDIVVRQTHQEKPTSPAPSSNTTFGDRSQLLPAVSTKTNDCNVSTTWFPSSASSSSRELADSVDVSKDKILLTSNCQLQQQPHLEVNQPQTANSLSENNLATSNTENDFIDTVQAIEAQCTQRENTATDSYIVNENIEVSPGHQIIADENGFSSPSLVASSKPTLSYPDHPPTSDADADESSLPTIESSRGSSPTILSSSSTDGDEMAPPPLPKSLPPPLPTSLPPPMPNGSSLGALDYETSTVFLNEDDRGHPADNDDDDSDAVRTWAGIGGGSGTTTSALAGWYFRTTTPSSGGVIHSHHATDSTITVDSGHGSVSGYSGHEDNALSSADELDVIEIARHSTPTGLSVRPNRLEGSPRLTVTDAAARIGIDDSSFPGSPLPSLSNDSVLSPTASDIVTTDSEFDDCRSDRKHDGRLLQLPAVESIGVIRTPEVVLTSPSGGFLDKLLEENGTTLADLKQQVLSSTTSTSNDDELTKQTESDNNLSNQLTGAADDVTNTTVREMTVQRRPELQVADAAKNASVINNDSRQQNITIVKGSVGLGFCIEGGIGSPAGDRPIAVKRLFRTGDNSGLGDLRPGDEIVAVNGESYGNLSHYEAWRLLKSLPDGPFVLTIARK